ncbi:hypothetical protein [Dongia sp.]|uniref:hypothetical protein n=1 Tax=Dongia sp. TaxID=1977262 RepID=UPI0035B4EC83
MRFARRGISAATILVIGLLLTVLTQVGGVIFGLSLAFSYLFRRHCPHLWRRYIVTTAIFLSLYLFACIIVVPALARHFNRVPLSCFPTSDAPYAANTGLYCLLNRHYVRPEIRAIVEKIASRLSARFPGTTLTYLDAGFPFGSAIPMPPHLSHKDGRKVDFALFYNGRPSGGAWPLGYWAFGAPRRPGNDVCPQSGLMRWDMDWLQPFLPRLELDEMRSRALVREILATAPQKSFLEPYLVERLGLQGQGVIFAGCHAARHDDHIHVQWQ